MEKPDLNIIDIVILPPLQLRLLELTHGVWVTVCVCGCAVTTVKAYNLLRLARAHLLLAVNDVMPISI